MANRPAQNVKLSAHRSNLALNSLSDAMCGKWRRLVENKYRQDHELCQSCMEEGEVETSRHFLLHCPAFARLRLKHLGNHTFGGPEDLAETDIGRLNKFVIGTKRFVDM